MAHEDVGRVLEAADQQADFLVDRKIVRPSRPPAALLPQPPLGGLEQRGEQLRVVFRFQHAEIAGGVPVAPQVQLVDLRGDAAHAPPAAPRQPAPPAGVPKQRPPRAEAPPLLYAQWGNPVRVLPIEPLRQRQKGIETVPRRHRRERQRGGGTGDRHAASGLRWRWKAAQYSGRARRPQPRRSPRPERHWRISGAGPARTAAAAPSSARPPPTASARATTRSAPAARRTLGWLRGFPRCAGWPTGVQSLRSLGCETHAPAGVTSQQRGASMKIPAFPLRWYYYL